MNRRKFVIIAIVASVAQFLAFFIAMFAGIFLSADGNIGPGAEATIAVVNVLGEPISSIFHAPANVSPSIGFVALIANSAIWGVAIAALVAVIERIRKGRRAAL